MKAFLALAGLSVIFLVGCSSDTSSDVAPVVHTEKTTSPAPGIPGNGTNNIPQSAKDAMNGKTK